jgi:hypothetical protein
MRKHGNSTWDGSLSPCQASPRPASFPEKVKQVQLWTSGNRRKLMYTRPIHWILGWSRAATLLALAYLAA